MRALLLPILLLLLASWPHRKAFARRRKCPGSLSEDKIIRQLFRNYTKMLPDSDYPDESVHVQIEMHVQDMGSLNEISADFEIDILFTQLWYDPSLSFHNSSSQCISNITMESRYLKDIWTPNTCIINAKKTSVHASPTDNIMFILYENGTVWINHRLSVKAPCNLDLRTFPFDTQTCHLLFESYSHNSEEVTLHWMAEPITLMKQITLPDFDMIQFDTKRETLLYPNGYWDELQASFTFKRRYGFYILQAYVPTYLTIIVSWVGFCMEPKALPARTTVGVSSLLALTLQFGNIHKNLPRVSYVKAMDVWMLGCISFVFGTMIELAIVCYITRCQSSRNAKRRAAAMGGRYNSHHHNNSSQRQWGPSRQSISALLAAGELPDGIQSFMEANMLGLYSRSSSMRLHSMPVVRNGGLAQHQRKISSGSSLAGPFPFNRRRKKPSGQWQAGDEQQCLNATTTTTDRPAPPQLVLNGAEAATDEEKCRRGNGELRMPKSVSGHSLSGVGGGAEQRSSMSFMPDQLSSTLLAPNGRPHWGANLAGGREECEENWRIIQPESIDKFVCLHPNHLASLAPLTLPHLPPAPPFLPSLHLFHILPPPPLPPPFSIPLLPLPPFRHHLPFSSSYSFLLLPFNSSSSLPYFPPLSSILKFSSISSTSSPFQIVHRLLPVGLHPVQRDPLPLLPMTISAPFQLIYWWYYLSLGGQFDPQAVGNSPSIEPSFP